MSTETQSLPVRESISNLTTTISETHTSDNTTAQIYTRNPSCDSTMYHEFHEVVDTKAVEQKEEESVPALPQKSALRASRLLDSLVQLKMSGTVETAELEKPSPLGDVYLSSEEDASSDTDSLSDYGYESTNEKEATTATPTSRRGSREDTARVVSVIFSGRPSIVDLTTLRRGSAAPSLGHMRKRSSTVSCNIPIERTITPASPMSAFALPERKSSLPIDMMPMRKPQFLNVDPFANGSSYSLDVPRAGTPEEATSPARSPRTPTMTLLKGVTRTFSLVRKRSRPALASPQPPQERTTPPPSRHSMRPPPSRSSMMPLSVTTPLSEEAPEQLVVPGSPATSDKSSRKNFRMSSPFGPSPSSQPSSLSEECASPISPLSPTSAPRRGLLSGFAARRKSIKLTGRINISA
ncbi:hypothetical protein SMACR_06643 [Sordaria macrospora]|uniref:Uncharacterized protein n=1 Tax=Sordaria macrospora TaxID=5147 RepID=A0A8S8ZW82_SORMA|nr:hypothetical protein SMACR_06643 [Sordaria macrospora]WPJ60092.1 hypothetical protein SMAC4_06643 [Sordaria macrospora]